VIGELISLEHYQRGTGIAVMQTFLSYALLMTNHTQIVIDVSLTLRELGDRPSQQNAIFAFCVQTKHKIMTSSKQQETCKQRVIILRRKYINRRKHKTTGAQHNADSVD